MDRNTFTGLFLIMLIMFGSFYLMKPSPEQLKKEQQQQQHADSIKRKQIKAPGAVLPQKIMDTAKAAIAIDTSKLKGFDGATVGTQQFVTLENSEVLIKLSTLGGRIYSVELKKYKTFYGKPLVLFTGNDNRFNLSLIAGREGFNTNSLYFKPSAPQLTVAGKRFEFVDHALKL